MFSVDSWRPAPLLMLYLRRIVARNVSRYRDRVALSRKCKKLPCDDSCMICSLENFIKISSEMISVSHLIHRQFSKAYNYTQCIVIIMGNSPCQATNRFHFLCLTVLLF